MIDGKYEVTKEIYIYDCLHGQLKMGVGIVFEITNNGRIGKTKDVLFSSDILRYCKDCYVKI